MDCLLLTYMLAASAFVSHTPAQLCCVTVKKNKWEENLYDSFPFRLLKNVDRGVMKLDPGADWRMYTLG